MARRENRAACLAHRLELRELELDPARAIGSAALAHECPRSKRRPGPLLALRPSRVFVGGEERDPVVDRSQQIRFQCEHHPGVPRSRLLAFAEARTYGI